jgi:hypothetical protein
MIMRIKTTAVYICESCESENEYAEEVSSCKVCGEDVCPNCVMVGEGICEDCAEKVEILGDELLVQGEDLAREVIKYLEKRIKNS